MSHKGFADSATFMEGVKMDPDRLKVPRRHQRDGDQKCQSCGQALTGEQKMSMGSRPAKEQGEASQLKAVGKLGEGTGTDRQTQQAPMPHPSTFQGGPKQ